MGGCVCGWWQVLAGLHRVPSFRFYPRTQGASCSGPLQRPPIFPPEHRLAAPGPAWTAAPGEPALPGHMCCAVPLGFLFEMNF